MAQESNTDTSAIPAPELTRQTSEVARARFEALLEAAVDAIVVIDGKGRIQSFSPAAEKMFGYRAAEVVGHNVRMLMPEPYRGEHDGYLDSFHRTGVAKIIGIGREVQALRRDGSHFAVDLSVGHAELLGDDSFVGILRDLTVKKQSEAALDESRRALASLAETFPGMVYRCKNDPLWTMLFASGGTLALTGYPARAFLEGEVVFVDLIHPDDRAAVSQAVDAAIARGEPFELRYRLRRRSGEERWVKERGVGVPAREGGRVPLIEGFVEDVTERVRAENEAHRLRDSLAHVDRLSALSEMASGIAHELNQPLTAISNYAQACRFMLQKGESDPDRLLETLEKLRGVVKHAGNVIGRLRALMQKRDREPMRVSVNDLVREVVVLLDHEAGLRGLTVRTELAEPLAPVMADHVQIQQVLINLLRNGFDASEGAEASGHALVVTTRATGRSEVEVAVSDQGVGISQEVAENLFHPFFTTKPSGLGLGLSICQSIVQAHGGHLDHAVNPEGGATFRFTLPTAIEVT